MLDFIEASSKVAGPSKEEAAAVYDQAARELLGEFARPNGVQLNSLSFLA